MKPYLILFSITLLFTTASISSAQSDSNLSGDNLPYNNCAAIFYNGNMLVDEYSPRGKCKLAHGMKGKLTVSEVILTDITGIPTKSIQFKVAIRNEQTNTLWMYTEKSVESINLEDILLQCQKGDKIVLLTVDKQYALSHNDIDLVWGC